MFCSRFSDDVSFGHVQRAWEDDNDIGNERLLSILNVTVHDCVLWFSRTVWVFCCRLGLDTAHWFHYM